MLHFVYRDTAISRDDVIKEVIKKLKDKNFATFSKLNKENIKTKEMTELIFNELLELQKTAIKNAKNYLKIMQIYTIQKVTILQLEYLN